MPVHNRLLPVASLSASSLAVLDVSDVPGHAHAPTHTMSSVQRGDIFKLYDPHAHALLRSLTVASTHWLKGVPLPALPPWLQGRIEPSAMMLWQVRFVEHRVGVANSSASPTAVLPFGAVVQIDRLSSFGAHIHSNHFHDGYNNVGRFTASDLLFEGPLATGSALRPLPVEASPSIVV